jgi:hypothetical protein
VPDEPEAHGRVFGLKSLDEICGRFFWRIAQIYKYLTSGY